MSDIKISVMNGKNPAFSVPVATWHVCLEMDNKFTSPQIRKTLKLLDDLGLVSGKKDGNNIVWTPIKEQSK